MAEDHRRPLKNFLEERNNWSWMRHRQKLMGGGRFFIDNNLVENAIRPLALGRKIFLFCGNHDAAIRAAIDYSLVDSCKALDVDPRE